LVERKNDIIFASEIQKEAFERSATKMEEELKYRYKYPHPAVTTDCVIFGFDGRHVNVLLIRRGIEPYKGMWAFPGGFLRMDQTLEESARRELKEETGLETVYMKQFGTFSDVKRDPRERVITTAFYALVKQSDVEGGDDAAEARWFPIRELPQLAFDHEEIFKAAVNAVRERMRFEPVGFELLEDKFTMTELQTMFEQVFDETFDRRNFQRKMMSSGVIEPLEEKLQGTNYRAPQLFRRTEVSEDNDGSIDDNDGSIDDTVPLNTSSDGAVQGVDEDNEAKSAPEPKKKKWFLKW
jgi:8-oxo-dGTP diphosphatase